MAEGIAPRSLINRDQNTRATPSIWERTLTYRQREYPSLRNVLEFAERVHLERFLDTDQRAIYALNGRRQLSLPANLRVSEHPRPTAECVILTLMADAGSGRLIDCQ